MPGAWDGIERNVWNKLFQSEIVDLCYMYVKRKWNSIRVSVGSIEILCMILAHWWSGSVIRSVHSLRSIYLVPLLCQTLYWFTGDRWIRLSWWVSVSEEIDVQTIHYGMISEKMECVGSGRGAGARKHSGPGNLGTVPQKGIHWVKSYGT